VRHSDLFTVTRQVSLLTSACPAERRSAHPGARSTTIYDCLVMAALCNRAGHYIFALWFLLSFYHPANFNGFRVLAALLHGTAVVGVSQTAALNRGRHLYSAGRPLRWALAHILVVSSIFLSFFLFPRLSSAVVDWMSAILPHMCEFRMQV